MNLLHIDSSIMGGESVSRELTARIVDRVRAAIPDLTVSYRDLATQPVGHLDAVAFAGLADGEAVAEFLSADLIVVGAPMYNFSIPSQLKAWMDHVVVPGKTFSYDASGVKGLAAGRRMIAVVTRGGFYGENSPMNAVEHGESYMRAVFEFLGITDIEFIVAEGIKMSP